MSEDIKKLVIEEILEFDFETQGERIEINEYERNEIKDYIINLQQENKQLKEEKQKAIEYIKNNELYVGSFKNYTTPLLKILGDKEKEGE